MAEFLQTLHLRKVDGGIVRVSWLGMSLNQLSSLSFLGCGSPAGLPIQFGISVNCILANFREFARNALSAKAADYPSTITTAPAVMSRPPATMEAVSLSPNKSHAKTMTSGTLSLSSGATREAGPNCKARK